MRAGLPLIFVPAAKAAISRSARTATATAPTVTAAGRSPGRRGTSFARAAASFASEREGRGLVDCSTHCLPVESGPERGGGRARIGGIADCAHHHDPARSGGRDLRGVLRVD